LYCLEFFLYLVYLESRKEKAKKERKEKKKKKKTKKPKTKKSCRQVNPVWEKRNVIILKDEQHEHEDTNKFH